MIPQAIHPSDPNYPQQAVRWFGEAAPEPVAAIGRIEILSGPKLALFCSTRCPGDLILKAYDLAQKLRDEGVPVISGFHSPVEKECLRILLRGKQPIIICPARSLAGFRLPAVWRGPLNDGRLLILSPFPAKARRVTIELARRRNEFVAAMANKVCFIHVSPGGEIDTLARQVKASGKPMIFPPD